MVVLTWCAGWWPYRVGGCDSHTPEADVRRGDGLCNGRHGPKPQETHLDRGWPPGSGVPVRVRGLRPQGKRQPRSGVAGQTVVGLDETNVVCGRLTARVCDSTLMLANWIQEGGMMSATLSPGMAVSTKKWPRWWLCSDFWGTPERGIVLSWSDSRVKEFLAKDGENKEGVIPVAWDSGQMTLEAVDELRPYDEVMEEWEQGRRNRRNWYTEALYIVLCGLILITLRKIALVAFERLANILSEVDPEIRDIASLSFGLNLSFGLSPDWPSVWVIVVTMMALVLLSRILSEDIMGYIYGIIFVLVFPFVLIGALELLCIWGVQYKDDPFVIAWSLWMASLLRAAKWMLIVILPMFVISAIIINQAPKKKQGVNRTYNRK